MLSRLALVFLFLCSGLTLAQSKVDLPAHFIKLPLSSERTFAKKNPKPEDEIRVLKARVKTLEDATRQLQEEINWIRYANNARPSSLNDRPSAWYCSVRSSFSRPFSGRGTTQLEARTNTLASCEKEESSIHCKDDKVECEKES